MRGVQVRGAGGLLVGVCVQPLVRMFDLGPPPYAFAGAPPAGPTGPWAAPGQPAPAPPPPAPPGEGGSRQPPTPF